MVISRPKVKKLTIFQRSTFNFKTHVRVTLRDILLILKNPSFLTPDS